MIIASLKPDNEALLRYKDRWQIETMFKGLKSSGFNVEDTHLTDLDRISKMVAALSVAFIWAYRVGIYRSGHIKPIQIKKHGRKAYSYFKYGLIFLAQALLNPFNSRDFEPEASMFVWYSSCKPYASFLFVVTFCLIKK